MNTDVCQYISSSKTVFLVMALVVLTSPQVQGCECPSCNYVDAAQNCQCCIYRQLGKRGNSALTFDLPVPSHPDLHPAPIGDQNALRTSISERLPSASRPVKRDLTDYYYKVAETEEATKRQSGTAIASRLLSILRRYGRAQPRMSNLSRLLEMSKLATALEGDLSDAEY